MPTPKSRLKHRAARRARKAEIAASQSEKIPSTVSRAPSGGDCGKHQQDNCCRLGESESEGGAKKWRRARRRQNGREHTLEKRSDVAMGGAARYRAATQPLRQRDFKNTEEIQSKNEHDRAHHQDEIRIRELESPRDFPAGRFQRNKHERQPNKPDENSADESETASKNAGPTLTRLLNEPENFKRDHRQYTRHQIENKSAEKSEDEKSHELTQRRMVVVCCDLRPGGYIPGAAIGIVREISKDDKTRQRVNRPIGSIERNAKGKLIRIARFQSGMADSDTFFRGREEL